MDQVDTFMNKSLSPLAQDLGSTPIFTVQLLGFNPKERTLFVSMFNLSKIRPIRYVEYDPASHPYADFYIISTESPAAVEQFSKLDRHSYGGAMFVGDAPIRTTLPVIRKPIKWAEVLMRLDELPRPKLPAQIHELLLAGVISENDLVIHHTPEHKIADSAVQVTTSLPSDEAWPQTIPIEPKSLEEAGPNTIIRQEQANAENALELSSLNGWYERDAVTTFTTEAAVLVVDDDIASRRYMAAKFLDLHYRVDFAESGEQALELFRVNRYNAVFLDATLPGIDGFEVCKQMKTRPDRRKTAIIFVTSRHSTFDRVKGAMAGCDAYLTKPLDQERLVEVLDKFLPNWRVNIPIV